MAHDTILVVDDEPAIVQVIGQRLTGEGFQVRAASDGRSRAGCNCGRKDSRPICLSST